ncbi:Alanine racemase [Nocardioides dokdonensis FR1436]|uniref:Alanine racemase n=1 Tax=Nocardioides dokdonensis FR1436 TaxID=1300347 RepID=A0A1A9GJF7_9ACTN|nr:alanine racemase [Nocardioides dokdonensis]ANH38398.1 Alanine racemase [Nocardioides dokdonensis FR1436]
MSLLPPHVARRAEIVVDLAAIRHNVRLLAGEIGPDVALMVVVKADGYGHGMAQVAAAAREAGAPWLGVATFDEALALRAAGDTGRLLAWLTVPGEDWAPVVAADVDVTAYSLADLDQLVDAVARAGRPARLQLKIDTGLRRGGSLPADWPALVAAARAGEEAGHWRVTGIWSHPASADDPAHPANDAQEQVFRDALATAEEAGLRPEVRHIANSAATLLRPSMHFDLVRVGIATYGLDPAPGHTRDLGLRPAMSVEATLAMTKRLAPGDGVSYGHTWVADAPVTVGLVPTGYADGVPRHAGNTAHIGVAGVRRPVRGRICMDQLVVEVAGEGEEPAVGAGDRVVLFGSAPDPTAQDWAEACDTISYEIVSRIGGRFVRRWTDSERDS